MHKLLRHSLCVVALTSLVGCAALITKSSTDESDVIHAGTTETQLIQRLGPPVRTEEISPPRKALDVWDGDHQVSLLAPSRMAVSASVFRFSGRLDKTSRAAQAGFDSVMTLGLAEIYLIPKALWERMVDEELRLTVWFDREGSALAYRWAAFPRP